MRTKFFTLPLSLMLICTTLSHAQSMAKPVESPILLNKEIEGNLAEWELLKAYLSEVEKRTDLEIQVAQSDYKLRRAIFAEANTRWWEAYNESQRKEKVQEYWRRYLEGQRYAQSIVSKNIGNYCKLLSEIDTSTMKSPIEDANLSTAFDRGFKSAYPECSIANLDQFLKQADQKISVVENKIIEVEKDLLSSAPDEKEVEVIYNELKSKYVELIKTQLVDSRSKLEASFTLPDTQMKRLMESAKLLADTITCSTLSSRSGMRFNCTVQVLPSTVKLGSASTYRVLKGQQETGVFQPRINFNQLIMASAVYLREVNPNNNIVRYLVNDLQGSLSKIQNESEIRIENAKKLIAQDFINKLRELKLNTIGLNRGILSKDETMKLVNDLLDVKSSLKSYARMDITTQFEKNILDKVTLHYKETLAMAGSITRSLELPRREIVIELADEESSDVVTLEEKLPAPTKAYLLGLTPEQVQNWLNFLAL